MSGHHEDSGLPSSGGLLHGHNGSASAQPGSQPAGETSWFFVICLYFMSQRVLILCHHWTVFWLLFVSYLVSFGTLLAGLSGSLNRSSSADIKREDKEDDENCSITDRSEDEKKDVKPRLGTRCLNPLIVFSHITFILIDHCMKLHGI